MVILIGLLIPLLGTMLGAAFVFLMKDEMSPRLQQSLLGFASGVMVAASVWSLLIPAMEMEEAGGAWSVMPAAVGFLLGMGFLLLLDEVTPHLHLGADRHEGPSLSAKSLSPPSTSHAQHSQKIMIFGCKIFWPIQKIRLNLQAKVRKSVLLAHKIELFCVL